jgi:membrane protein YqaA with SNARE-associated domain
MTIRLLRFANVLLAGLVVGSVFGIWLGYNPASLSASAYIEQQQHAIEALNVTMPVLGAICIVLTLVHALLVRAAVCSAVTKAVIRSGCERRPCVRMPKCGVI